MRGHGGCEEGTPGVWGHGELREDTEELRVLLNLRDSKHEQEVRFRKETLFILCRVQGGNCSQIKHARE